VALTPGTRLGPYEIESALGAGGMGEVYRARDPRLDRTVAIKALPAALAGDAERVARLEREARLLAALDHPNIARIHGLEEAGGAPHLVLEFVEGETLATRLSRGPLGIAETLEVGGQIAAAIEAAHERGIVHRDLKPGNVMLTPARTVKVLDFGLAKGGARADSNADLSISPTAALSATGLGVILGTAPYMSPEQARGREVDRRADVWALGCVLFECLSGRQAFPGETVSDVIASILQREPEWNALPPGTPQRLRDLVRRCLVKELEERPRDVGDLRRELAAIALERTTTSSSRLSATPAPSLAVLYFENLAHDQESEYFCAGITEDILTDLSKIRGLRVASRNAVSRYRGAPADIPRIAGELGVRAVLEGSVRRAGDRVRITAQLVNAADGFHLWAERYDRTLQDVFAVQEEIAAAIASALSVALSPREATELGSDKPENVAAYDLYLKGRQRYGSYTAESLREALSLFTRATEIDPGYALAWAGIADCHGQFMQWGVTPDTDTEAKQGLEAAARAIALNPRLPEGHKAEALVRHGMGDRAGERAALERALQANPRFVPAMLNLAVDSFAGADIAGAERIVRRALEIDPQEPFATTWLALLTGVTSRPDEMLATAHRLRSLSDDAFYVTAVHLFRIQNHLERGDVGAASRSLAEGLADGGMPPNFRAASAAILAREGRLEEAREIVRELQHVSLGATAVVLVAVAAVQAGEVESARAYMARTILGAFSPCMVRLDPALHPLLEAPPFAPRRLNATLVWPLEAPMIDSARHRLFREVRVESGLPEGNAAR